MHLLKLLWTDKNSCHLICGWQIGWSISLLFCAAHYCCCEFLMRIASFKAALVSKLQCWPISLLFCTAKYLEWTFIGMNCFINAFKLVLLKSFLILHILFKKSFKISKAFDISKCTGLIIFRNFRVSHSSSFDNDHEKSFKILKLLK